MPAVPEHVNPSVVAQNTEIPITFTDQHEAQLIHEVKRHEPEARKPFDQANLPELRHLIDEVLEGTASKDLNIGDAEDPEIQHVPVEKEPAESIPQQFFSRVKQLGEEFKIGIIQRGAPPRLTNSKKFLDAAIKRAKSRGEKLSGASVEQPPHPSPVVMEPKENAIATPAPPQIQEQIAQAPDVKSENNPQISESVSPAPASVQEEGRVTNEAGAQQVQELINSAQNNSADITSTTTETQINSDHPKEELAPHIPGPVNEEPKNESSEIAVQPLPENVTVIPIKQDPPTENTPQNQQLAA